MARKSRKETAAVAVQEADAACRAAIYVRLSVEDTHTHSVSIETQQMIIARYLEQYPEISVYDTYMLHFSKRGENWSYSSSTALLSPFFAPQMASLNAPILVFLHFFTDFLASVATVCTYGVLFDTQFGSRVGHR